MPVSFLLLHSHQVSTVPSLLITPACLRRSDFAHLGAFGSEEAAARAYDRACLQQHGAQANTNYPASDYAPPATGAQRQNPEAQTLKNPSQV